MTNQPTFDKIGVDEFNAAMRKALADAPPMRPPVDIKDCGHPNPTLDLCPYAQEINGVDRDCRCCDDCRYQCAQDI